MHFFLVGTRGTTPPRPRRPKNMSARVSLAGDEDPGENANDKEKAHASGEAGV